WQFHKYGSSIARFELELTATADDLLGRNPINTLRPRTHEFDSSPRDDERLKSVGAQVHKEFQQGLINHFGVQTLTLRMPGRADPILYRSREFVGGHSGMSYGHDLQYTLFPRSHDSLHIALKERGERF